MTKLHEAVAAQDEPLVTKLLSPDTVNVRDADGCIPLHLTAEYTKDIKTTRNIINTLIKEGSDLDAKDNDDCIPLRKGIRSGNTVLFHCLKDREHTEHYLKDVEQAMSVFFDAVYANDPTILTWVISTQPSGFVNRQHEQLDRISALHYAIQLNCFESFKWLLNQPGINLHQFDIYQRAPLHYTIRYEEPEYFAMLWTMLCQLNLISDIGWYKIFKYACGKYVPLRKLSLGSQRHQQIKLEDNDYYIIPSVFFEMLLTKIPHGVSYGFRLAVVLNFAEQDIENLNISTQIEHLNLSRKTYIKMKFIIVLALVIAYANFFGLLREAPPLTVNQNYLKKEFLLWDEHLTSLLQTELYRILYPHYVMRQAQMRLQIAQRCILYRSNHEKIMEFVPEQILAFIWQRWNIDNKLETISVWVWLFKTKDTKLPNELNAKIIWEICRDGLEKTVLDCLPLFPYYNIQQISKLTYTVFLKLLHHLDIFYENLHEFATLKKQYKNLSEQALRKILDDRFAVFFETKKSLQNTARLAAQQQIKGLLHAIEHEKTEELIDSESDENELNNDFALNR